MTLNVHVRNLGRNIEGHLIAEATITDERRHTHDRHWTCVSRRWGSWQSGSREHADQRDLLSPVSAALQAEAVKYERREQKQ